MDKTFSQSDAISLKKNGFKKLNSLIESYINESNPDKKEDHIKKAALISKWLSQYANYIDFEERFNPTRNISYKRGDVVFVNFGFNLESEFGGEHYAVVLDQKNRHNASMITVIPLSSFKPNKPIHPHDVFLGNELYDKLRIKATNKLEHAAKELLEITNTQKIISGFENELNDESIANLNKLVDDLQTRSLLLRSEVANTEKLVKELSVMKAGSIAKIEQIRSISKIRIYQPKRKSDPLYGIRLSNVSMDKINDKLKELYIFSE